MLLARSIVCLFLFQSALGIGITAPDKVVQGEALEFSWHDGDPPFILKILIDNVVVSQLSSEPQWRDWQALTDGARASVQKQRMDVDE